MLVPALVLAAVITSVMATDVVRAAEPTAAPAEVAGPAASGPITVQASPVVGLTDGTEIPVTVTAGEGVVILSSGPARVCRAGVVYDEVIDFNPQGGNCPDVAFAPSTVDPQTTLKLHDNAMSGVVHAPVGTAAWGGHELTCGPGAPCALVVRASVSIDGGPAQTELHASTILTYQTDPSSPYLTVETGPTSGLVDGQEVPVTVTAAPGTVILSSGPARVCRTGVGYDEVIDFNPQGGNCPDVAFAPSTVDPQTTLKLHDNELAGTAHAPVGTATWGGHELTCGPGAPCALVVRASISVDGGPAQTVLDSSTTLVFQGDDPVVPTAPQAVSAVAGNASAAVSWTAPASDGGSPITGYTVLGDPGSATCTTTGATSCTVEGLANGTAYTFTVRATNAIGEGASSSPSAPVTPLVPASFTDVPEDHPFYADITWLAGSGIAEGYPDGTFGPGNQVTRQAMAAFLYRFEGEPLGVDPACATAPFSDVPADHAFCGEIAWLVDSGIAAGYSDGTFGPGNAVTRQAMSAFLYRVAGEPLGPDPACATAPFTDVPADHPFCGEIAWLVDAEITAGYSDGTFGPGNAVTRQAMAAFLHRMAELP